MKRADSSSDESALFEEMVGGDLLSHNVTVAVPSALEGLTAEFGMGSGVPPPLSPPTKVYGVFDPRIEQT